MVPHLPDITSTAVRREMWQLKLGRVHPSTLTWLSMMQHEPEELMRNAIVSNLPQLALSLLYLSYNGLITTMAMASEWASFAHSRKGLRVSRPRGFQRSTYFLQLPYRFSIPLMIAFGLLHWLVSQTVFLVNIEWFGPQLMDNSNTIRWTEKKELNQVIGGYSPLGYWILFILGVLLIVPVTLLGAKKLPSGMPIAGSCSFAIAAACHPESASASSKVTTAKLQWGVESCILVARGVGHCTFSADDVEYPIHGNMYA
jgi:hypothetical protein